MKNPPRPNRVSLILLCGLFFCPGTIAFGKEWYFNVRAYGAAGDGGRLDSGAINEAIEAAAAAGGGTVLFPAGQYRSYSIRLKSNVTLYLESGATIIAADPPPSGEPGGYDPPEPNPDNLYQDFGHTHWHNSLIWGEDLESVAILGPGMIFGQGLSQGHTRRDPYPRCSHRPEIAVEDIVLPDTSLVPGPFNYPNPKDALPAGVGNKAIALKNCRNVILRDFTILHGGHFGILATGVDNLTIDNLMIDTNRDGIDIDACVNVRISNCSVNSPFDDGICLKSSFGLGYNRVTENVVISNCYVSGFDEGTLLDGTRQRNHPWPTGRIKFGTEANGGFRNITISNCVFEYCRGLALEQVDGGVLEDVAITNITMREVFNAPIFVRLGARLRAPEGTIVDSLRRVRISNVVASNIKNPDTDTHPQGILILGIPGHPVEDLTLSGILMEFAGNGTVDMAVRDVPELIDDYPEPGKFGDLPAWGLFARHVRNLKLHDVELRTTNPDKRPAVLIESGDTVRLDGLIVPEPADGSTDPVVIRSVNRLYRESLTENLRPSDCNSHKHEQ